VDEDDDDDGDDIFFVKGKGRRQAALFHNKFTKKMARCHWNQLSLLHPTSSDPPLPKVGSDLEKRRVGREIRVQNSLGVRKWFAVRPEQVGSDQIRPV